MSTQGLNVKISLKTTIKQNDEKEDYELIVFGKFYQKNGTTYLIYDEIQDKGRIHTVVKHHPENGVQINRTGAVHMRLAFKHDQMMAGSYKFDGGSFILTTHTKQLSFAWDPERSKGKLELGYSFLMEHIEVGNYHMVFDIQKQNLQ